MLKYSQRRPRELKLRRLDAIARWRHRGASVAAIVEITGIPRPTVYRYLKTLPKAVRAQNAGCN